MNQNPDQPPANRRRIATPQPDPMAPPAPPAAAGPPAGGRPTRRRAEPTVPVFVRTAEQSKQRFDDLADERRLTARAMFEQLVEEEWNRTH